MNRFKNWLIKVIIYYIVFIVIGYFMSLLPQSSQPIYYNLRMFFMVLGPLYLMLIIQIIKTFRKQDEHTVEKGSHLLLTAISFLFMGRLLDFQKPYDLVEANLVNKGFRHMSHSEVRSLKIRHFLNIFMPVCFYFLILEILTLFSCIVTFAPLSDSISNGFIFAITLTLLMLIILPLILLFISKYHTDQSLHKKKLVQDKEMAIDSNYLVLESDPACRQHFLRLPKVLFLFVCPAILLFSFIVLFLTKNHLYSGIIVVLRTIFLALALFSLLAFLPLLIYWLNCSGTSKVQRIYIHENQFIYAGYSGSMEERSEFSFILTHLDSLIIKRRALWIKGAFIKKTCDAYGTHQKKLAHKRLWIPRTFSLKQEKTLISFLKKMQDE